MPNRRLLWGVALLGAALPPIAARANRPRATRDQVAPAERHIQPDRLRQTLEKLSEFGRNADGGVTRLGFSDADMAAR